MERKKRTDPLPLIDVLCKEPDAEPVVIKMKVSASFSGVIATGSYENARPSYSAEIDVPVSLDNNLEEMIRIYQKKLQEVCLRNFTEIETQLTIEKIERQRADMRFYDGLPSVTSIINWDADFFVSKEELQQYCSQGNLIDAQFKSYVLTGKVLPVEKIQGTWADIVILKKGSLGLATEGWDIEGFITKYPIKNMKVGIPVISQKHQYGGTPDICECEYEGKRYLLDVKRTLDKGKNGKQCSAYIMALEENGATPYAGFIIAQINDKTEQGFSKPWVVEGRDEIAQYFGMFLKDREHFKKRFGV